MSSPQEPMTWERREAILSVAAKKYLALEEVEDAKYSTRVSEAWSQVQSGKLTPERYDDICNMAWEEREAVLKPAGTEYHALAETTMREFEKVRDAGLA